MEFCSNADIEDLYLYCAINIVLLRTLSFNVCFKRFSSFSNMVHSFFLEQWFSDRDNRALCSVIVP